MTRPSFFSGAFRQAGHDAASAVASGGACGGTNCGQVSSCSSGAAFSMLTRRSYHARLAGDRIAVGEAIAALALGQQFGDEMVEQEAACRLRRIGIERGCARTPPDRVPGPHRVRN